MKFRPDPAAVLSVRPAERRATLLSRSDLNHDMAEFTFHVDGDPAFLPGQYALFHLPGIAGARVYSMSNLPEDGHWSFIVRRVPGGAATTALFDSLNPGDEIKLDGPYGLAYFRPEIERDLVLLAGGSGLSPMVSIAKSALRETDRRIHAYFGGRGVADCTPAAALALDQERIEVTAACSVSTDGWTGRTGFIHEVAMADLGDSIRDKEVYFAGPAVMAQAITQALHVAGVPREQVHFDEFY